MSKQQPVERLAYSPAEVAESLAVSVEYVRQKIAEGELRSYKEGRLVRIARVDLDAYLDRLRQASAPPERPAWVQNALASKRRGRG